VPNKTLLTVASILKELPKAAQLELKANNGTDFEVAIHDSLVPKSTWDTDTLMGGAAMLQVTGEAWLVVISFVEEPESTVIRLDDVPMQRFVNPSQAQAEVVLGDTPPHVEVCIKIVKSSFTQSHITHGTFCAAIQQISEGSINESEVIFSPLFRVNADTVSDIISLSERDAMALLQQAGHSARFSVTPVSDQYKADLLPAFVTGQYNTPQIWKKLQDKDTNPPQHRGVFSSYRNDQVIIRVVKTPENLEAFNKWKQAADIKTMPWSREQLQGIDLPDGLALTTATWMAIEGCETKLAREQIINIIRQALPEAEAVEHVYQIPSRGEQRFITYKVKVTNLPLSFVNIKLKVDRFRLPVTLRLWEKNTGTRLGEDQLRNRRRRGNNSVQIFNEC